MRISPDQRRRFDEILQQVLDDLPAELRRCFEEIPLVAEDYPSETMQRKLELADHQYLCGVHSGIPLTRRSVWHSGTLPTIITIYRDGILRSAADRKGHVTDDSLRRHIRITVLHELGHHFGMGEEDLRKHGYG